MWVASLLVALLVAQAACVRPLVVRVHTVEALDLLDAEPTVRRSVTPGVVLADRQTWNALRARTGLRQGEDFDLEMPEKEVRRMLRDSVYASNADLQTAVGATMDIGAGLKVALLPGPAPRVDKPSLALIANIHGDEVVSREIARRFVDELHGAMADLLHDVDVWVLPTMNPAGFDRRQRYNAANKDLNRCFPNRCGTRFVRGAVDGPLDVRGEYEDSVGIVQWVEMCSAASASEMAAVRAWLEAIGPTAVVSLHGGAEVVSIPMDCSCTQPTGRVNDTGRDYALHHEWGRAYAAANPRIRNSRLFPGGVIVGAAWYQLRGGLQDWALLGVNRTCASITVEVSNVKWPPYDDVANLYWPAARHGMRALVEKVAQGVRGRILDTNGDVVPNAVLYVEQLDGPAPTGPVTHVPVRGGVPVTTHPGTGWFFRMLPEGVAHLIAAGAGHVAHRYSVTITNGRSLLLEARLEPLPAHLRAQAGELPYVE